MSFESVNFDFKIDEPCSTIHFLLCPFERAGYKKWNDQMQTTDIPEFQKYEY